MNGSSSISRGSPNEAAVASIPGSGAVVGVGPILRKSAGQRQVVRFSKEEVEVAGKPVVTPTPSVEAFVTSESQPASVEVWVRQSHQ
jgi:hypothetical protein